VAPFEIGLVMPIAQFGPERTTPRWPVIREIALRAEAMGFDTLWTPDELLWRAEDGPPQGVWDGVSMAGAVAATTSRVKVGTWVLSALHRNPGIIAKTAETLDEISGGRFVFGLGAGHEWPGQARAFGLPEDRIFARFEEALRIIVPLIRTGHADFEGPVPRRPRPAPAAGRPAPERDPAAHRWQRAEGPASCGPPRRHLERVRRGAGARRRAGPPARDTRRDLR